VHVIEGEASVRIAAQGARRSRRASDPAACQPAARGEGKHCVQDGADDGEGVINF